jgi:hypothetical protein
MAHSKLSRRWVARGSGRVGLGLSLAFLLLLALPVRAAERDFQLRWIPPADADLAGYRVYFAPAPMDYDPPERVDEFGPAPTDPNGVCYEFLTGLDDSRDYWIVMTAVDTAGNESPFSNEILIAALPPPPPPPDPDCAIDLDCADDGDVCNGTAVCLEGVCEVGPPLECPVTDCALGVCDPTLGCQLLPVADGVSCDDGDLTTPLDRCVAGLCRPVDCVSDFHCDDQNPCNGSESCFDFVCIAGSPAVCSGGTACLAAVCDPLAGGCVLDPVPDGTACDDGDAATSPDRCTAGVCTGDAPPPPPDPECGIDADCADDGDVCNGTPLCLEGVCQAGPPLACPGSDCSLGVCDPTRGCQLLPVADGLSCDDRDPTTPLDRCVAGMCRAVECVSDLHCDDQNPCNGSESCSEFSCTAGSPLVCAGGTGCLAAVCDPLAGGCVLDPVPDGTTCDDGDPTTSPDRCAAGVCTGAVPPPPPDPEPDCDSVFGAPHSVSLTWTADPATTMTVTWTAPANSQGASLRYRRGRTGPWTTLAGTVLSSSGCEARYRADLVGLEPRTRYEYQVSGAGESGPIWSKRKGFRTARLSGGRTGTRFSFFASNGLEGAAGSAAAGSVASQLARLGPEFVLGGGGYAFSTDAIRSGVASDAEDAVERWIAQASAFAAHAPFLPVFGDTEHPGLTHGESVRMYTDRMPLAAGDGLHPGTHSFDVGSIHFLGIDLDAGALVPDGPGGSQTLDWIESDLAQARARGLDWIVAYLHADLFSSEAGVAPDPALRSALVEVFERHAVDLVLSGDGNSYERSFPMLAASLGSPRVEDGERFSLQKGSGVVYLRAGSGGRTLFSAWDHPDPPPWSAVRSNAEPTLVLATVFPSGPLLVSSLAVPVDGSLPRPLDRFVIWK